MKMCLSKSARLAIGYATGKTQIAISNSPEAAGSAAHMHFLSVFSESASTHSWSQVLLGLKSFFFKN